MKKNDLGETMKKLKRFIDIKKLRLDLSNNLDGEDGFTQKHLDLPDKDLLEGYIYVYGEDSLKEYIISQEEKRFKCKGPSWLFKDKKYKYFLSLIQTASSEKEAREILSKKTKEELLEALVLTSTGLEKE